MKDAYLAVVTSPFLWIAVATLAVLLTLQSITPGTEKARATGRLTRLKVKLGLDGVPDFIVLLIAGIWCLLFAVLLGGIFFSIYVAIANLLPTRPQAPASPWDILRTWLGGSDSVLDRRLSLWTITAMTATLAAVVAFPLTLLRTRYNSRQTETSEQSLITGLINTAVEGLGAEKTVKRIVDGPNSTKTTEEETAPNIEVRVGAIYTLERIAQDSDRDHVQIMEILTAYIRQNSPAEGAERSPLDSWARPDDDATEEERQAHADRLRDLRDPKGQFRTWVANLKCRTDIQAAAQVIARRTARQIALEQSDSRYGPDGYRLDLRETNLRAVDVSGLDLRKALLTNAHLEGANLGRAHLESADIRGAHLEGSNLEEVHLNGAVLRKAHLKLASLWGAHLERADLQQAHLEGADLTDAHLEWANLMRAELEGANLKEAHLEGASQMGAHLEDTNLMGASLERANLMGAHLEGANLMGAHLERTSLGEAHFEGANLWYAQLERASLFEAHLEDAKLTGAHLEKANLVRAFLEGADLMDVRIDSTTALFPASLRGARLKAVDWSDCTTDRERLVSLLSEAFGDASVSLPHGLKAGTPPLEHWPGEDLDMEEFDEKWRAFQVSIGYAPPE